jgi:hypothetical protein
LCDFEIMNNLPDFSKLQSRSLDVFCGVFICLCCLGLPAHGQVPRPNLALQWATYDSDRIADWAAQLPAGEAQREGILGAVIA